MALITDPDSLSQGTVDTSCTDLVFGTPSGATVTVTSAGSFIPVLADNEYVEIRDHSDPENNGLYKVADATPATNDITLEKMDGVNPVVNAVGEAVTFLGTSGASTEKSVHIDTSARKIYILAQGNVIQADGVTMLALHSFLKEEWKTDTTLPGHPFPMLGIDFDAGKWEFGTDPSGNFNGWGPADDNATESIYTRKAIRNAGWIEYDDTGLITSQWTNVTTLGTFEDSGADLAYYAFGNDPTDTTAATDFDYAGPVNEAVQFYDATVTRAQTTPNGYDFNNTSPDTIDRNDGGSFITDGYTIGSLAVVQNSGADDGTYEVTAVTASTLTVIAYPGGGDAGLTGATDDNTATIDLDQSINFNVFLRVRDADPNGKTFAKAGLADAGESALVNKVIKYPLSNQTDTNISETDANISTNTPYTEVRIRYLSGTYNREVDTTTKRDFGIVIDVGTYSQSNGAAATTSRWDSANLNLGAGEALADYTGGTLIVHEGTNQGSYTISGTPVDSGGTLQITVTGTPFTVTGTDESFTMDRATPLTATATEIYEKVQYQLRQDADIDETGSVVTGSTADELISFIASTDIRFGEGAPVNPNGGGSGVIVEGFDSNDTNSYSFFDNTTTSRTFPFVAAGTLNFNAALVADTDPDYWLYFEYTTQTTVADFAISAASGSTASLDSAGSNFPTLAQNDYVNLGGFTNPENNGIWIVTDATPTAAQFDARKIDGKTVVNEGSASRTLDQNPIDSDDAIIVNNNAGSPITGAIGASSINFDFDYDNNVQGGRTAATNAAVVLKAVGLENAQYAEVSGLTITRATGLSFSITSAQERNYSNP